MLYNASFSGKKLLYGYLLWKKFTRHYFDDHVPGIKLNQQLNSFYLNNLQIACEKYKTVSVRVLDHIAHMSKNKISSMESYTKYFDNAVEWILYKNIFKFSSDI